jgi:uncharacterized protein YyaL (SSP411 family)
MFLTPAGEPFWGGTYFPPNARYGRPGFADVLQKIAAVYREQPQQVTQNVEALRDALGSSRRRSAATPFRSMSSSGPASSCCPKSIPSMAASARRRSFRRRPCSN